MTQSNPDSPHTNFRQSERTAALTTPGGPFSALRALQLTEKVWFNALWFQSTWFLCVLGRDALLPIAAMMLLLHAMLVASVTDEMRRVIPVATLGIVVDALLSAAGVFDFNGTLIPLWLCVLWLAFATTLTRSLAVFVRRRWVTPVVGAIGVPFNYVAGAQLGAVDLPLEPWITAAVLVPVWAVLLPSLYALAASDSRECR